MTYFQLGMYLYMHVALWLPCVVYQPVRAHSATWPPTLAVRRCLCCDTDVSAAAANMVVPAVLARHADTNDDMKDILTLCNSRTYITHPCTKALHLNGSRTCVVACSTTARCSAWIKTHARTELQLHKPRHGVTEGACPKNCNDEDCTKFMKNIKERWGCRSLQLRCPLCLSTVKGARQLATLSADEVVKATSLDALSCSVMCCIGTSSCCACGV